jgi:hypothetical protein
MPLVLTSNDPNTSKLRSQWHDVTGVRYHFPNMYRNMIKPGERFVYYRGVHREQGPRGPATYFGAGLVGEVWPDPETAHKPAGKRSWYCEIVDYLPFLSLVNAKTDNVFLEEIPQNMWRSGVRNLPDQTFQRIVHLGGLQGAFRTAVSDSPPPQPPIEEIVIPVGTKSLLAPAAIKNKGGGKSNAHPRRTRHAKLIGDRAEEIALKWIAKNIVGAQNIRWIAQQGETPGWDIEYQNADGAIIGVEVKGTSGAAFTSFELTANELYAAKLLGSRFLILLISDCLSKLPSVQMIKDIDAGISAGVYTMEPTGWKISGSPVADQPVDSSLSNLQHGLEQA